MQPGTSGWGRAYATGVTAQPATGPAPGRTSPSVSCWEAGRKHSDSTKHSDGHTVWGIGTHYETLGLTPSAGEREIRDAYRALARRHHPDQSGSSASMAAINEAYRVLRDPAARSRYDAELRRGSAAGEAGHAYQAASGFTPAAPMSHATPPSDPTPARFPWKLAGVMAGVGALVVLIGAALYEPAAPAPPDNVLEPGSCVEVEPNANDVREVNCTGDGDLVVHTLVAFGDPCPLGHASYRDRQGLGMACVVDAAPTSGR